MQQKIIMSAAVGISRFLTRYLSFPKNQPAAFFSVLIPVFDFDVSLWIASLSGVQSPVALHIKCPLSNLFTLDFLFINDILKQEL